jgi:hypothetical protein
MTATECSPSVSNHSYTSYIIKLNILCLLQLVRYPLSCLEIIIRNKPINSDAKRLVSNDLYKNYIIMINFYDFYISVHSFRFLGENNYKQSIIINNPMRRDAKYALLSNCYIQTNLHEACAVLCSVPACSPNCYKVK